jgi:DnaJ-class molecular chaperone
LLELESTTFTKAELQKAYRNASKKYHPDKNLEIDTTDKFIEIKTA